MVYLIGILSIVGGTAIIFKTEWILRNAGPVAWAEQHLGVEGGSRIFYKLVGLGFIVFGFLLMAGVIQSIVTTIFVRPQL